MPSEASAAWAPPRAALQDATLQAVRAWVQTHFGITFLEVQIPTLTHQLTMFCEQRGILPEELVTRLVARDRELTIALAEAVSTNYTFFFRENDAYELLASTILPGCASGPVRIWSAACSSGDEAYSAAIVARECLGEAARDQVRILGTDISERQVRNAEQGFCARVQLASVSDARRQRWFAPAGLGQLRVDAELRAMCTFRRMNLATLPWPFEQRFHVIFLRNVLYYLHEADRLRIIEACYDAAEPGAWLLTSVSEPMFDVRTRWRMLQSGVFRKAAA